MTLYAVSPMSRLPSGARLCAPHAQRAMAEVVAPVYREMVPHVKCRLGVYLRLTTRLSWYHR